METELTNTTTAVGNYNSIRTAITSTASVVTMVDGLTITKTADKPVWADGDLTYTIVIENEAERICKSIAGGFFCRKKIHLIVP